MLYHLSIYLAKIGGADFLRFFRYTSTRILAAAITSLLISFLVGPWFIERLKQLQVQVVPEQMAAHGVALDQVMEASASALDAGLLRFTDGSLIGTGGFVDTANQRLVVHHVPTVTTADSLSDVTAGDPSFDFSPDGR